MGLHHCKAGEVFNLVRFDDRLPPETTLALVKTRQLEVIRMFLSAGKEIPEHHVPGEITVQCLSGQVKFTVEHESHELRTADWLLLAGNQRHSLHALEDSVLLVTICLQQA